MRYNRVEVGGYLSPEAVTVAVLAAQSILEASAEDMLRDLEVNDVITPEDF